jgi:hypothetical protein
MDEKKLNIDKHINNLMNKVDSPLPTEFAKIPNVGSADFARLLAKNRLKQDVMSVVPFNLQLMIVQH